ncbi:hypothetical protein JW710_02525 [Candidatus Dojkabacteria bacterium]|nr:hypothetical protein [Candidatus Dojkabacteria bacterium]
MFNKKIRSFIEKYGLWILVFGVVCYGIAVTFFRNIVSDESIYLRETMIISELLRQGKWIGNYAVGVHGFLFKIPVAIVYWVTGPSVFVATLFHIFLGAASCVLFYLILKKFFKLRGWALAGVFLFATTFDFLKLVPTYYREIPAVFSLLLFIYIVLEKKSWILQGLLLVLVLDAKDHVFFAIIPGFILYICIEAWRKNKKSTANLLKTVLGRTFLLLLPSVVFIILMFCTPIIPVNIFLANTLGLIQNGFEWAATHFTPKFATANLVEEEAKTIYNIPIYDGSPGFLKMGFRAVNLFLSYFGKLVYPRTFTFISVPKIIIVPVVLFSLSSFIEWVKKSRFNMVMSSCILFSYLGVYIFRASYGRYLFPVVPLIVIMYVFFLKEGLRRKRLVIFSVLITFLLVAVGLFFEEDFVVIKALLNVILISGLAFFCFARRFKDKNFFLFKSAYVFLLGSITASVSLAFLLLNGQVSQTLKWGVNMECREVMNNFDEEDGVWMNDIGWTHLPAFYSKDLEFDPQWNWHLLEWVPKKGMLYVPEPGEYYAFKWYDINVFKKKIEKYEISEVGFIVLEGYEDKGDYGSLDLLESQEWLVLEKKVELKNKTLYVYRVVED